MKQETKRKIQGISVALFVIYLVLMTYFLFFAESLGRDFTNRDYSYNLHLFREIKRFWEYRDTLGSWAAGLNIAGNVICFIPLGAILPVFVIQTRKFLTNVLLCLSFSLLVECVQLVTRTGSFDVDDLLLNTIGGATGFLFFTVCNILRRKHYG